MKWRILFFVALLTGGFLYLTSRSNWELRRVISPIAGAARLWSGPDVARTAGLSPDELNNIEVYKMAHLATVNITTTILRRNIFFEIYPSKDTGSGFVIDSGGNILTNSHVIIDANHIEVTLSDQSHYKGQLLTRDPVNDLALIQIHATKKLPFLKLGDSDTLQVGQKVLAIGNPFGLDGTLTTGIISSLGRTIRGENNVELEGMTQTDAAINPGNSGGPMLDSQGSVIGINTAILGSGGSIGIGFAMPINRAKALVDDFTAGRKRPRLGVSVVFIQSDLAEELGLPAQGGLLVQEVAPRSTAESAGIRGKREQVLLGDTALGVGGDFILAIDGRSADRPDAISRAINRKRSGDSVELTIFRNGRTLRVNVRLGDVKDDRL